MKTATATRTAPIPTLREAWRYFVRLTLLIRPYWIPLLKNTALGLVMGLLGLITPYFTKLYYDSVLPARDLSLLEVLVIGSGVFAVANAVMGAVRGYYVQVVTTQVSSALALMYFNHLQHLPVRFYDERRVGEVMSRMQDMQASLGAVSKVAQTMLVNGIYLALVPPLLLVLDWRLTLLAMAAMPFTLGLSAAAGRITRKIMKARMEAGAELSAMQVEAMSQIRTLKAMGIEHAVFRGMAEQTDEANRLQLQGSGLGVIVGVVNSTIRAAFAALYTWYAWRMILTGEMTLGTFMAYSMYLGYVTGPVGSFAGLFVGFQQTAVTLGRAFEYLDMETEQDPHLAYTAASPIRSRIGGAIELRDVSFGYREETPVLNGVTMRFAPGTVTAIVGSSGAGKSTILRLLCRMERPTSGQVLMDGRPLQSIPLHELRRQLAIVWQEPTLLRGTIRENLVIGMDDVDQAVIDEAIDSCQLADLIASLPKGYATAVAEWGSTLSGGQRQRFALARALVRRSPVLLLDECTSQMDVRTEEAVLQHVLPGLRGCTVILVTHRLATAALADQVYVLEHGGVVGAGSPRTLATENTVYRQMMTASRGTTGAGFAEAI